MNSEQNDNFESTRLNTSKPTKNDSCENSGVESIRLNLETTTLRVEQDEESTSPPKSLALKNKLSGLNSKLSSYVVDAKKTESRLTETLWKCKQLEEESATLKENSRQQIGFLQTQLDDRIRKTVLAEEKRHDVEQRLEQCQRQLNQNNSELAAQKKLVEELEENLTAERRGSKTALEELVLLREQVVQERLEYNQLKQQMMKVKIEHEKLRERFKLNTAELTMNQSKLAELQNQNQYSVEDVHEKLVEQKQRLSKKHSEQMTQKLREKDDEIERLNRDFHEKLSRSRQSSVSTEDFELLKTQLEEQHRRADAADSEANKWRQKLNESEKEMQRERNGYEMQLEHERRRRDKLNRRLLAQSRAQNEIRQELETYRKLIEHLDAGGGDFLNENLNVTTFESVASPSLSPSSPISHRRLPGGTPMSPEARTMLLRRALTPRRRSLSGGSDSFVKNSNQRAQQSHES